MLDLRDSVDRQVETVDRGDSGVVSEANQQPVFQYLAQGSAAGFGRGAGRSDAWQRRYLPIVEPVVRQVLDSGVSHGSGDVLRKHPVHLRRLPARRIPAAVGSPSW